MWCKSSFDGVENNLGARRHYYFSLKGVNLKDMVNHHCTWCGHVMDNDGLEIIYCHLENSKPQLLIPQNISSVFPSSQKKIKKKLVWKIIEKWTENKSEKNSVILTVAGEYTSWILCIDIAAPFKKNPLTRKVQRNYQGWRDILCKWIIRI